MFLESPHQVDMKTVAKSSKHFFGYFNTLDTHSVWSCSIAPQVPWSPVPLVPRPPGPQVPCSDVSENERGQNIDLGETMQPQLLFSIFIFLFFSWKLRLLCRAKTNKVRCTLNHFELGKLNYNLKIKAIFFQNITSTANGWIFKLW